MRWKLLSTDIDGTLTGRDYALPPRVKRALREAAAQGMVLCANSGRPLAEMEALLGEVPEFAYAVTSNGCSVYRLSDRKLLLGLTVPEEACGKILDVLTDYQLFSQAFVQGRPYTTEREEVYLERVPMFRRYTKATGVPIERVEDYGALFRERGMPEKFYLHAYDQEQLEPVTQRLNGLPGVYCTSSGRGNIEVVPRGASKAEGLRAVCRELGISPEDCVAMGDNENDVDMVELAGLGIAMGNGTENLKRRAGAVTKTVEEEGAAWALEQWVLDQKA